MLGKKNGGPRTDLLSVTTAVMNYKSHCQALDKYVLSALDYFADMGDLMNVSCILTISSVVSM